MVMGNTGDKYILNGCILTAILEDFEKGLKKPSLSMIW